MASPPEITAFLTEIRRGNESALDELLPVVYGELRRIAARYLHRERDDHTLQPTALVNEAYLRLVDQRQQDWRNRAHFFAVAAQAMRRILIDHARSRGKAKRGGGAYKVPLDDVLALAEERPEEMIALDDALRALAAVDPRKSRVVELRFFGGLSVEETAEALGVSEMTVMRDWSMARAWLHREMSGGTQGGR